MKRPFRLSYGENEGEPRATAPRLPRLRPTGERDTATQPPPVASARFPDAPPTVSAAGPPAPPPPAPTVPPKPTAPPRPVGPPAGAMPSGAESWLSDQAPSAPAAPTSFEPADAAPARSLGARIRPRIAVAVACAVLGAGLIGGTATAGWITGEGAGTASQTAYTHASGLWHSVPVDRLFPPTVDGEGAGPGGADRTWTRIAVAPDTGCSGAFDPLLSKVLTPAGCLRLLRATYTDATSSHVITVGMMFTKADVSVMRSLSNRFRTEGLDRRRDLLPRPYAAPGTAAAGFGDAQRASWTISVLTDAPVVVYAVSGFADHRTVTAPEAAADAMQSGATSDIAQSGLGHETQGLADRIERALRKKADPPTEKPS